MNENTIIGKDLHGENWRSRREGGQGNSASFGVVPKGCQFPVEAVSRFWNNVTITDHTECWIWSGSRMTTQGYGRFSVSRVAFRAHRFSWMLHNGPIPIGVFVCHACDITSCVNPAHLWLGTPADNVTDCTRKGRWKLTGLSAGSGLLRNAVYCRHGHEFTKENTYIRPDGFRDCRACKLRRQTEYETKHGRWDGRRTAV